MKKLISLIVLISAGYILASAPILIPMTDKITYDYLDYLNVSGKINIPFTGSKPYRSDEIYKKLNEMTDPDTKTKNFIERFEEEYIDKDNRFGKAESENTLGWFDAYWNQSYTSQNAINKPLYLRKPFTDNYYRFDDISQHITDGGIVAYFGYKEFLSLHTNSGVMIKHDYKKHMRDEYETLVLVPSGGEADFSSEDHTETALLISGKDIMFSIGKYPVAMGSGMMNSLTLTPQKAYYENFMFSISGEKLKFTTLTGSLLADSQTRYETDIPYYAVTNSDTTSRADYIKREKYLSAHRLEWKALNNLSFGVNEMVISGDRTIEMGYLVPVLPLFWMGHYYGDHDNSLISFDVSYQPLKNYSVYGELLFDDETFTESWTKNYMNKWAVSGGFYNSDFLTVDGLSFNFEYARVEPYVYGHKYHINRYMNLDYYLSMPGGGDTETLNYKLGYLFDHNLNVIAGYNRINKGEPRWGEWDQPNNYKLENKVFLRGTVEKSNLYYAEVSYRYNKYLTANFYYSHTDIINYNHNLPAYNSWVDRTKYKTWTDEYAGDNSDDNETNNYESYTDYYNKKVKPAKKDQVYSNNTFRLELNMVFKNYLKDIF